MMTVTVTPGKQFAPTERVTIPKLNALGLPTFAVTGTVGTSEISDASVTGDKTTPSNHFYAALVSYATSTYSLTYTATPVIVDGMVIAFKANADALPDTTNGIQITIVGTGSTKKLLKNKTELLVRGDIVANQIVEARYDSGAGVWQMTSHLSNAPVYYTATATGTNDYTLTITPPASYSPFTLADLDGRRIRFKVPNTQTVNGARIIVNIGGVALTQKPLYKNFNQPIAIGDLRQYQIAEITYESNTTASTDAFQLLSPIGNPQGDSAVIASARNLTIENNSGAPDSQINVTADEVVLRSDTVNYSAKNVNLTINMALTPGNPNALDFATEQPGTWYYVWVIYNGTTVAGLFSVESTSPHMPTGYTYKALVGAVRNDGSSNFIRSVQFDRRAWINSNVIFTNKVPGGGSNYEVLTGTDLNNFRGAVPPIARFCSGTIGASNTGDPCRHGVCAVKSDGSLAPTADAIFIGENLMNQEGAAGGLIGSFGAASGYIVPVRGGASYNIQWRSVAGVNSRLTVSGYGI